ncbi:MAG: S41 family peptidase [Lachnospiraceae bacterium]|nr:S41 family peptidase [Lachnospiraceae bacterium]
MNNKQFWIGMVTGGVIALVVSFLGFFVLGAGGKGSIGPGSYNGGGSNPSSDYSQVTEKMELLEDYIDSYYLFTDRYEDGDLAEGAYKGMFESLNDIYSVYYTVDEYASLMESSSGAYSGIGCYVQLDTQTGDIVLIKPMKNSPSEKAGIHPGDILIAVDGESVVGWDLDKVVALIKGEQGTSVVLTITREGEENPIDISVTRDHIEVETIEYEMLEDKIGYVKIVEFDQVTEGQFDAAVTDLESQGMEKLIVDVRDNPGGDLDCVLGILDRLLPKGELLRIVDKYGYEEEYDSDSKQFVQVPIAVLVNENSASASEVFSGAMKDRGAATIVGTNTFGKGIVQTIFSLRDGSGIKITTAEFFTPSGNTIHGVGISPDVEVALDESLVGLTEIPHEQDNQLQKAIEVLK